MQIIEANDVKLGGMVKISTDPKKDIEKYIDEKASIEAWSKTGDNFVPVSWHGLMNITLKCFQSHVPLVLTPDVVWLTIVQGVAKHIQINAESLRHHFVKHEGKAEIVVHRNEFIKGNPDNDWAGVFSKFSDCIRKHIGDDTHKQFISDFSTTGPVELAASEIVLMDAMESYFSYRVRTMCGIPYVALEGTVEDWERIRERAKGFNQLELSWWLEKVDIILSKFVDAAKGNPDKKFFSNIFNEGGGSGGPYYSGWIFKLIPYSKKYDHTYVKNRLLDTENYGDPGWGSASLSADGLPSSLSSVPFIWEYYGDEMKYRFIAGIVGGRQDTRSFAIRPEIGWAVMPSTE